MEKLTTLAANAPERFIEKHEDDESIRNFVKEQLRTTTKHTQRSIESHTVEAARLGCSRKEISNRRNLISTGLVSLQRACANAFLEHLMQQVRISIGCLPNLLRKAPR